MTTEISEHLQQAKDEATAEANRAQRHLRRLDKLEKRLESQVLIIRNGSGNPDAETQAGRLAGEAFAVRWAMLQIDPNFYGPKQVLEQIAGAAK